MAILLAPFAFVGYFVLVLGWLFRSLRDEWRRSRPRRVLVPERDPVGPPPRSTAGGVILPPGVKL